MYNGNTNFVKPLDIPSVYATQFIIIFSFLLQLFHHKGWAWSQLPRGGDIRIKEGSRAQKEEDVVEMLLTETTGPWLNQKNTPGVTPGPGGGGWRSHTAWDCSSTNTCMAHLLTSFRALLTCQLLREAGLPWPLCPHSHPIPTFLSPYPALVSSIALNPPDIEQVHFHAV